ncbi:hypothetical protein BRD00_04495 [Halobacteriales archaeon QS_8_69_26]|nr:MAG: hypothetical protein BRD00_04495 [Halobacteriales archaeon QS_8_69_26]
MDDIDRRVVEKRIGVSPAAVRSFATGIAAADGRIPGTEFDERYASRDARVRTVEAHASDLLSALTDREVIGSPSVEAFDLDSRTVAPSLPAAAPVDAWNAVAYTDPESGRWTDHLMLSKSTAAHDLTLHLRPRCSEAYAVVDPRGADGEFALDASHPGETRNHGQGSDGADPRVFPVLYDATYVDCAGRDGRRDPAMTEAHGPVVNC